MWVYRAVAVAMLVAIPVGAQAVIVGRSDEGTIDLEQGTLSAALTLTYDVSEVVAHVQTDQLTGEDTKKKADQLQAYAERFPLFFVWADTESVLKRSIIHVVRIQGQTDRIAVKVYFTIPNSGTAARTRLFEEFYCTEDCLTGKLPQQRNIAPWAVQEVHAEADRTNSQDRTPADLPWTQRAWSRWASLR